MSATDRDAGGHVSSDSAPEHDLTGARGTGEWRFALSVTRGPTRAAVGGYR
ncbi:MAG: hypothetical protein K2Y33_09095 [Mycolicibacterium frederiksbergense]|nr:hypothetical protein [Mycolicibacterium frederiksbergense]